MKGQSVELVPLSGEEDYALLAEWCASSAYSYGAGAPRFRTVDEVRAMVARQGSGYLMVRTPEGHKVGVVEWHQDGYTGSFTLGIVVGDSGQWGRGYGFEAVTVVVDLLFHAYNAHRIQTVVGAFNKPMMQIVTQEFIRVEGVLRDYFFLDGEYHDAVIGSILRSDYYGLKGAGTLNAHDVIPAAEKQEARQILAAYLATHTIGV